MPNLNIQSLKLRDYRCFERIDIDFHPQLTVLVAANGAGKTSILDAVAVAFGPFIGAFDEAVGKHFEASDIRQYRVRESRTHEMEYAAGGVRLEASGSIPGSAIDKFQTMLNKASESDRRPATWRRSLSGPTKSKTTIKDAKELIEYGKRLQEAVRTPGGNALLPLVAYYGTGRLWQQKKLTENKKIERTSRTVGYADCLDPASSYKAFVAWFRYWNLNAKEARIIAQETGRTTTATEFDGYIRSVAAAVNTCLEPVGWKDIEYSISRDALVAHHDLHGELPVELLSDGIRNMIGMVADIAFRTTKLNGHLGSAAASETPGIVLIDEVDMHLHPEWQQVVLQNLMRAFPLMQFIVTTHSPQVLSTVRRENIRVIDASADGITIAAMPIAATYGEPSGDVMHSVMQVDPQPPVAEKDDLLRLTEWVDQGRYQDSDAVELLNRLSALLGEQHPQLQRLRRSIRRQEGLKS